MRTNKIPGLAGFLLAIVVVAAAGTMSASRQQTEIPGAVFSLVPIPENPRLYSLVISDDNERSISGSFSVDQLQILRAIMTEAEKFAWTLEPAGKKEPVTTRFMDKQEPSFIMDVQQSGNQSLFFLTLKTEIGQMTWEAGRLTRGTMREVGFFFDLLTRLESILPKPLPR